MFWTEYKISPIEEGSSRETRNERTNSLRAEVGRQRGKASKESAFLLPRTVTAVHVWGIKGYGRLMADQAAAAPVPFTHRAHRGFRVFRSEERHAPDLGQALRDSISMPRPPRLRVTHIPFQTGPMNHDDRSRMHPRCSTQTFVRNAIVGLTLVQYKFFEKFSTRFPYYWKISRKVDCLELKRILNNTLNKKSYVTTFILKWNLNKEANQ